MKKLNLLGKKYPFLFAILCMTIFYGTTMIVDTNGDIQTGLLRYVLSIVAVIIMWPSLGKKYLDFPGKGWKLALKLSLVVFIFSGLIVLPTIFTWINSLVSPSAELAENFEFYSTFEIIKRLFESFFLYISVGIVEELVFRRALFGGFIEQFHSKNRFIYGAIISSFIFGFLHVATNLSTDVFAIITIILKTMQGGVFGYILCGAMVESKNVWPIALAHAINDIIPSIISCICLTKDVGSYVQTSASLIESYAAILVYSIFILVCIPSVKKATKLLKKASEEDK